MGKQINYWITYKDFLQVAKIALDCGCTIIKPSFEKIMYGQTLDMITENIYRYYFYLPEAGEIMGQQIPFQCEQKIGYNAAGNTVIEAGFSLIRDSKKEIIKSRLFAISGYYDESGEYITRPECLTRIYQKLVRTVKKIEMMEKYLRRKGYFTDFTGKHWKIRLPQYQHFTRLDTLDERWTPENIRCSLGARASFGNKHPTVNFAPELPEKLRVYVPFQRTSHIYRLFLYWEYQLGILPKGTTYQPTSPFMKEELRKLDTITAQVDYLAKNCIETLDDLLSAREAIQCEMDTLTEQRTKLQNKIRRASPAEKERLRAEKQTVTEKITACRKKLKLNVGVEERSVKIQDTMDMVYINEEQHRQTAQIRTKGERYR